MKLKDKKMTTYLFYRHAFGRAKMYEADGIVDLYHKHRELFYDYTGILACAVDRVAFLNKMEGTALAPDDTEAPEAWWVDVKFDGPNKKHYTYWTDHCPDGPIPPYAVVESPYSGKTLVSVRGIRAIQDLSSVLAGNWKRIIGFVDTTGYDRYIADTKRRKIERDVVEAERKLQKLRSQLDKLD